VMEFCLPWPNLFGDLLRFLLLGLRPKGSLAAENLFLRKQLAFYQERRIKPRRTSHPARLTLLWLSRWFDWRSALTVVTPRTFIDWHRKSFRLYWRRKCQAGRPQVIKTPVHSPQANSLCERLIGTLRRECLDWIIPLTEDHLRRTLLSWLPHYNRGRPHSSLGPGLPDPPPNSLVRMQLHRHRFDRSSRVVAHPVLNGLHHEYSLLDRAA